MKKKRIIIICTLISIILAFSLISYFQFNKIKNKNISTTENRENIEEPTEKESDKDENIEESIEVNDDKDKSDNNKKDKENKKDTDNSKKDTNKKDKENNSSSNSNSNNSTTSSNSSNITNNKKPNSNTTNNSNTNSNNSSNNNSNTSTNNTSSSSSNNNETSSSGTSNKEKDEVDELRKNIQNTYGITIKYGNEIGSYKPKRLTPEPLTNQDEIKKALNTMKTELVKYPNGLFKTMKNNGMPLTIFIIASISGNAFEGFTDHEFGDDIKITLVNNFSLAYTMNHEIMHYIDKYLEIKMYPASPYTEYIALNPPGFSYGNINTNYNFKYNASPDEVYFFDSYSQYSVKEDRAQIFKQMITRTYKLNGLFNNNGVLNQKANIIDKQIRQYFNCANSTLYWDKYIKGPF